MTPELKIAILGAGMGGVGLGMRLRREGEQSFALFERAARIGGTWRDNVYPGCGCDVPSSLYWFEFDDRPPDWTRSYALQPEILGHLEDAVVRAGLVPHLRLGSAITRAVWDDEHLLWRIALADGRETSAPILVSACGQLGEPSFRGIEGRESFAGESFHSARWRHDVDLRERRVILVGTGASAAQIVPEVAKVARTLTVIQRSPPYVVPRNDRAYTAEERARVRDDRAAERARRAEIFVDLERRFDALVPGSEAARAAEAVCRKLREAQIHDPDLRAKLTPNYTLGCKRLVASDDYLPAFNRPNVKLVVGSVDRVEPNGVRTRDGALHEGDVIVYATGFESLAFLSGVDVVGRGGRSLHADAWRSAPQAYLGMTVPEFPGFFMIYGPNTNLTHNSVMAMFDAQYEYILGAVRELDRSGASLDLKPRVLETFSREVQHRLAKSAFAAGCSSWYVDDRGRVVTNWWGRATDYRRQASRFRPEDYERVLPAAASTRGGR